MEIVQKFATRNPCYKTNQNPGTDTRYTDFQKNGPRGLMLHSVGCAQPNAMVFVNNWNKETYSRACVHGFIDGNTGTVYQILPWNYMAWHAGGSANNTHVGVEMCEPGCMTYGSGATVKCSDLPKAREIVQRTYNSAVELFAMLCKEYNLDPLADGVIISHSEGAKRGVASSHVDPDHLWKQLGMSLTMDGFRKDVKAKMDESNLTPKPEEPETPAPEVDFIDYTVYITADALNYRSGPGLNYKVNGTLRDHGVYTIVDEQDGWGKLKSGAGWILLSYTKKLTEGGPVKKPEATPEPTPETSERIHVVTAGESWWSIAAKEMGNGLKYEELAKYNGKTSKSTLYVGDKVKIPGTSAAPTEKIHVVTKGESWWTIAASELGDGTRYKELAEYNGKKPTSTIYVGDKIKIPVK